MKIKGDIKDKHYQGITSCQVKKSRRDLEP